MKVSRMLGLDLDSWNTVMVAFLAIGAVTAVVVGVATFAVIKLQKAEALASKDEFDRYKLSVAEKVAVLESQASSAQQKTEEIRADNLRLQGIMRPRRLGSTISITSPDDPDVPPAASIQFDGIRPFVGTPVLIQVVPDFESQTLANDMRFVLASFDWRPQIVNEAVTHVPSNLILEGVRVTYTRGSKFVAAAEALAASFTKAGLTGPGNDRWVVAQGLTVNLDGSPADFPLDPSIDPSIDAVIVLVGMKPIPSAKAGTK